ncbi:HDOD domain-containing protein [Marinomonas ostreistagni]|uniref:HDOD domain-containing protein n=1 Tax=Marinomonas ostreistagni TaxID=359209 RepID=UPI00195183FB|nr:HDOD domain-containing protein [Marinomonas ostreistagni]MBM6549713.1 HDOD domain-containing protein [Marinomonas ostreistagni]
MNNKSPFGLNEWLLYLQDRKFPAGSESIAKLTKQIKTPDETLDRMQKNIASEPMLAFAILNQANTIVEYKRNDIKSPLHAASMIGMKGIGQSLSKLDSYTPSSKNKAHISFLREIQISYEAAAMARRWAIDKKISHTEDVFWLTFFRDAVRWLLWYHACDAMEQITQRLRRGDSPIKTEMELLGCRIDELSVALFKYWKVPNIIIDSFLTDQVPTAEELQSIARLTHTPDQLPGFAEDKRITILMNSPLILAYCATRVAQEANVMGWASKQLPFFYRVIAAILHIRLGDAIQLTHYACVEAAQDARYSAKPSLAAQLLSPMLYTRPSESGAGNLAKKVKSDPLTALQKQLEHTQEPKPRASLAMKAMLRLFATASQQILILKHDQATNKLSPMLQYGLDLELIKKVQWNTPSSVINKLISKRVAVHFNDSKLSTMFEQMPAGSKSLFASGQHLFLASAPVTDTETYIYWLIGNEALDGKQFDLFKRIIKLAD